MSCSTLLSLFTISLVLISCRSASNSTCPQNKNSTCTILPFNTSNPPDVWLNVPDVSVEEISLIVQDIKAHVSISASVASLVSINAGVDVSIDTVNLTILGVKAQVQLAVYLDNIAKIVTRTMASLDLNPLLTQVIDGVVQTVNNLLGKITRNGTLINQIIDNVGNIVDEVLDSNGQVTSSTVVGNYLQNMTFTGVTRTLENGNIIKQYTYPPAPGSGQSDKIVVNIVFDSNNNILDVFVVNPADSGNTTTSTNSATTTTPPPVVTTTTTVIPASTTTI